MRRARNRLCRRPSRSRARERGRVSRCAVALSSRHRSGEGSKDCHGAHGNRSDRDGPDARAARRWRSWARWVVRTVRDRASTRCNQARDDRSIRGDIWRDLGGRSHQRFVPLSQESGPARSPSCAPWRVLDDRRRTARLRALGCEVAPGPRGRGRCEWRVDGGARRTGCASPIDFVAVARRAHGRLAGHRGKRWCDARSARNRTRRCIHPRFASRVADSTGRWLAGDSLSRVVRAAHAARIESRGRGARDRSPREVGELVVPSVVQAGSPRRDVGLASGAGLAVGSCVAPWRFDGCTSRRTSPEGERASLASRNHRARTEDMARRVGG
jgi:hypothetical protein